MEEAASHGVVSELGGSQCTHILAVPWGFPNGGKKEMITLQKAGDLHPGSFGQPCLPTCVILGKPLNLLRPQLPLTEMKWKILARILCMQSWAWVWHSWYSVDIAAIFRVPIYKTGKDAYVSTACGRGSCRTSQKFYI